MRQWLSGKKTYIGFASVFVYAALIQFASVPSEESVWGLIVTWTGVSAVIHVDKSGK